MQPLFYHPQLSTLSFGKNIFFALFNSFNINLFRQLAHLDCSCLSWLWRHVSFQTVLRPQRWATNSSLDLKNNLKTSTSWLLFIETSNSSGADTVAEEVRAPVKIASCTQRWWSFLMKRLNVCLTIRTDPSVRTTSLLHKRVEAINSSQTQNCNFL